MNGIRRVALLGALGVMASAAYATTLKIELIGSFGDCVSCYGTDLEALIGTSFTVEFVFPQGGADFAPADPLLGLYRFGTDVAHFNFDSELDSFDQAWAAPIEVQVRDCASVDCVTDVIWIAHDNGAIRFDLSLANYPAGDSAFSGDSIPELSVMQALAVNVPSVPGLNPTFSVYTSDWAHGVDTFTSRPPTVLSATVSLVPVPSALLLFVSALGVLRVKRRRAAT